MCEATPSSGCPFPASLPSAASMPHPSVQQKAQSSQGKVQNAMDN